MILKFSIFKPYTNDLVHGITTKHMGSFNDGDVNFEDQLSKLHTLTKARPIFANQAHKDTVLKVVKRPDNKPTCDGFITQKKDLPLMVKVADCQGILIFDPKTNSIAAIHSGWRSSCLNIIGKTIQKMQDEFKTDPSDLLVGISPSLGPCCAQFSDPKKELPDSIQHYVDNNHVDFWALSMDQLKKVGIPENQIEISGECTKCTPDKYYSHRNNDSGRMAVFISLK